MITQPTLILDEEQCKVNIQMMYDKAMLNQVEFRPHFKTHQSLEIGRWFKNVGVNKITVSSLNMARYFSEEWEDITVAFPVNINEIDVINPLASDITLNLTVENIESITYMSKYLNNPVNIFIKIDVGYNRTGIAPNNLDLINGILDIIKSSPLLTFAGFLGHAGHSYKCRTSEAIKEVHASSLKVMANLKEQYPEALISLGDTPTCSVANDFTGVNEIRPGNFVFYDLTQNKIGSNTIDQIAVALACPIVAIHKNILEIVVYGGGAHFSKDRLEDKEGIIFGRVVSQTESGWGDIIPDMYVSRLSQEHGIISVPKDVINNYTIGDHLLILPVHSCMTGILMKRYTTCDGRVIDRV